MQGGRFRRWANASLAKFQIVPFAYAPVSQDLFGHDHAQGVADSPQFKLHLRVITRYNIGSKSKILNTGRAHQPSPKMALMSAPKHQRKSPPASQHAPTARKPVGRKVLD